MAIDPINQLLLRDTDDQKVLRFCERFTELMAAAAVDTGKITEKSNRPSAKLARGTARRDRMQDAMYSASTFAGLDVKTGWTNPPTWSFPSLKLGAFSLVDGVVRTFRTGKARSLQSRGKYVKELCQRNAALDPQVPLFQEARTGIPTIIPAGTFGALIVAEYSSTHPDAMPYLGVWVPDEKLTSTYRSYSLNYLMAVLRERIAGRNRGKRQEIKRKMPRLKPKKPSEKN